MNTQDTQLSRDVLLRVRSVYMMRRVWNIETAKGGVLLFCCLVAYYMVSIPNVIVNMSQISGITEEAAYLFAAFLHTEFLVQGTLVVALASGGWIAFSVARNLKPVYMYPFRLTTGLIQRVRSV